MAKYTMQNSSNIDDITTLAAIGDVSFLSPTTFTLSEIGYSNQSGNYVSAYPPTGYTSVNGGFWGVPLSTGYYYNGSTNMIAPGKTGKLEIPFVDKKSTPMPCIFNIASNPQFLFPNGSGVGNANWPYRSLNYYKELPTSTSITITISYSAGKLQVKQGTTSLLNTAASPYILIEIQAPGGKGGKGAYAKNDAWINSNDKMGVAGGGGGGSGGYLYLSANASAGTITLTKTASQIKVASNKSTNYIIMTNGGNGGNGSASNTPSASGGTAGAAGTVTLYNSSGTAQWSGTQLGEEVLGNFCVIQSGNGGRGGAGSKKTVSGSSALSTGNTVSGTTGGTSDTVGFFVSTHPLADLIDNTTTGGTGEPASNTQAAAMAGGGGGAASAVGDGGGWNRGAGPGAGGLGESGWTDMSSAGGVAGGAGGLWIQYNPS
jgi:hypothetical protein